MHLINFLEEFIKTWIDLLFTMYSAMKLLSESYNSVDKTDGITWHAAFDNN